MPLAATLMDLEIIMLSEEVREEQISYDITYIWNLKKMTQMNLFTKQKQSHRRKKQTYDHQRGKMPRRDKLDKLEVWEQHINMFTINEQQTKKWVRWQILSIFYN